MNKTLLEELIEKKDDSIIMFDESLPSSEIRKNSIDLFIPLPIRIMYLELYYKKEPEQFGEMISCINGMYAFSRTIMLKEYLFEIAKNEKIPIIYRIDCSKNLNKEGYTFINQLCKNCLFVFLPTPIRVETILYLMKNDTDEYKEESRTYFCEIVNDIHIESLYSFNLIQRLENHF